MERTLKNIIKFCTVRWLWQILACFILHLPYSAGQCAYQSNIVIGTGACTYDITATAHLYLDSTFEKMIQPPLLINGDDDFVNVLFHLNSTSKPTNHLLLERCWVTKTNDHVVLIINNTVVGFPGCPKRGLSSIVSLINNGISADVRLRFHTFFLLPNENEFYLHCSVGACDDCAPEGCFSPIAVSPSFTRTAGIVSIGPIKRSSSNVVESSTNSRSSPVILILTIVFTACIIFVIILIILFLLYMFCKRQEVRKQNARGYNNPVLLSTKPFVASSFSTSDSNIDTPESPTISQGHDNAAQVGDVGQTPV